VIANTSKASTVRYDTVVMSSFRRDRRETKMTFNPYRTTASSGFTRVAAYIVQHLLDDVGDLQPIDELGRQQRPNPASRGLNQPHELAEFMSRTIAP